MRKETSMDYTEYMARETSFEKKEELEYPNMGRFFDKGFACCENCPNNPKNNPNSSGICMCTLPHMEMVKYG